MSGVKGNVLVIIAHPDDETFVSGTMCLCHQIGFKNAFFAPLFDQPGDVLLDAREFNARRSASLAYHQSQAGFFLSPHFPRAMRDYASALRGIVFGFTKTGRRRIPIVTPRRFFERFPIEGLAMQKAPADARPHFFAEHFAHDGRVRMVSDENRAEGHLRAGRRPDFQLGRQVPKLLGR